MRPSLDPWSLLPFLLVASSVWALMLTFLGWRVLGPLGSSRAARRIRRVGGSALVALALAVPTSFLLLHRVGTPWVDALHLVTFLSMGACATALVLVMARDALGWLGRGVGSAFRARPLEDPERRRALVVGTNAVIVALAGWITGVGHAATRRVADVVTVEVPIPGLPLALDRFRIVQISDLHVGPTIRKELVAAIVAKVNAAAPDLVAVTGDLVDGPVDVLAPHVAPLAELKSRHGTWFVTGNHEYYSGVHDWVAHVVKLGMTPLIDEHRVLDHDGASILVAGVTDLSGHRIEPAHTCDPGRACAGAAPADLRLLLAHQPNTIGRITRGAFDLQLSGHTHGGQFVPFTWLIALAQRYTAGLHLVAGTWLYVNRGTTWWGPPIRLGAPQEITLLTLRSV